MRVVFRTVMVSVLLGVGAVAALGLGAAGLSGRAGTEELRLAEKSLRRAAVQCYALEGFYPVDAAYLEARYGVQISDRLIVHYEYIASNLMPDITVIESY